YAIYGFVRLADEIVDTFHDFDKKSLLEKFKAETFKAIDEKISTNPVLHSFQLIVHQFKIEKELVDAFLCSMELDLEKKNYDDIFYKTYIYGSAEAIGLMCLRVFCEGDDSLYDRLNESARKLGAAFQKVNFLRDMKSDFTERGRVYFPGVDFNNFNNESKKIIEKDIDKDFRVAYSGMMQLPRDVRPGVYTAFIYYRELFKKIQRIPASRVKQLRIRVPDFEKLILLFRTYSKFGMTMY
ncbi:MAG: squalene/phytoene synthase family protein, partial [Bacteroidota bacterium]